MDNRIPDRPPTGGLIKRARRRAAQAPRKAAIAGLTEMQAELDRWPQSDRVNIIEPPAPPKLTPRMLLEGELG